MPSSEIKCPPHLRSWPVRLTAVILADEMVGAALFEEEEVLHLERAARDFCSRRCKAPRTISRRIHMTRRFSVRQTSFTLPSGSNHAAGLFASPARPRSSGLSRRVHGPVDGRRGGDADLPEARADIAADVEQDERVANLVDGRVVRHGAVPFAGGAATDDDFLEGVGSFGPGRFRAHDLGVLPVAFGELRARSASAKRTSR